MHALGDLSVKRFFVGRVNEKGFLADKHILDGIVGGEERVDERLLHRGFGHDPAFYIAGWVVLKVNIKLYRFKHRGFLQ